MYPNFFYVSIPIVKSFGVRDADKGCPSGMQAIRNRNP
jgi:hypothetical protein